MCCRYDHYSRGAITPPPAAAPGSSWDIHARDVLALMGAHTLMDNQACVSSSCGDSEPPKMFRWSSDWFKVRPL